MPRSPARRALGPSTMAANAGCAEKCGRPVGWLVGYKAMPFLRDTVLLAEQYPPTSCFPRARPSFRCTCSTVRPGAGLTADGYGCRRPAPLYSTYLLMPMLPPARRGERWHRMFSPESGGRHCSAVIPPAARNEVGCKYRGKRQVRVVPSAAGRTARQCAQGVGVAATAIRQNARRAWTARDCRRSGRFPLRALRECLPPACGAESVGPARVSAARLFGTGNRKFGGKSVLLPPTSTLTGTARTYCACAVSGERISPEHGGTVSNQGGYPDRTRDW